MNVVNLPLLDVAKADYGEDEEAMIRYREEGTARALAMDNRGPIRYGSDGKIDPAIIDAYKRYGFYVFENVLGAEERLDIEQELAELLERVPVTKDAELDKHGRPAIGADSKARTLTWVKPLADPLGGTDKNHGRHPAKMAEPEVPEGAPEYILQIILGDLQFMETHLRVYGHPGLLAVAEAVHGPDFTPFNEGLWIKHPHLGGSISWHQDGWTHWDSPDLDGDTHGFNFMVQLYGCDAANGLWVVPGSHLNGKADIKAMVDEAGSDRIPEAVPVVCGPGDAAITNRQAIHGSFANTSDNVRVTLNMGFHRRSSVLGIQGGGIHNPVATYDDNYIRERSRMIMYGIDARRQRFPDETPYSYAPLAAESDKYRWNDAAKADIKDYNLQDIGI